MNQRKLFYLKKAIIWLLIIIGLATSDPPESPCPQLFQYKFDGSDWLGLIELNNITKALNVNLIVGFSLPITLPTPYRGHLSILEETSFFQGKPLLYKIVFPVQNPIARVTDIVVNNALLCSGPSDENQERTSYQLYHVFSPNRTANPNNFEASSTLLQQTPAASIVSTTISPAAYSLQTLLNSLLNESKKVAQETPG